MNVLSLFDGISCGHVALEKAGFNVDKYYASEVDKYAIQITQKNYPGTIHIGDVTQVKGNKYKGIDLLMGGSPCQGFSFAGKQLNFIDPRSRLFFEFVRLLEEINPKYFLLENVRMKKEYQDVITQHLGVKPIEINSALVSAQNRKRLYWTNIPGVTQPEDKGIMLKDIVHENVDFKTCLYNRKTGLGKEIDKSTALCASDFRGLNRNQNQTCVVVEGYIRRLTPIECERLQTLPDNYTAVGVIDGKEIPISNTQRYKMLGNGWTVDVIAHILKHI